VKGLHFVQTWKKQILDADDITTQNIVTPKKRRLNTYRKPNSNHDETTHQCMENEYIRLQGAPLAKVDNKLQTLKARNWDPLSVFMDDTQFEIQVWTYGLDPPVLNQKNQRVHIDPSSPGAPLSKANSSPTPAPMEPEYEHLQYPDRDSPMAVDQSKPATLHPQFPDEHPVPNKVEPRHASGKSLIKKRPSTKRTTHASTLKTASLHHHEIQR
jgi:hypothetical protein